MTTPQGLVGLRWVTGDGGSISLSTSLAQFSGKAAAAAKPRNIERCFGCAPFRCGVAGDGQYIVFGFSGQGSAILQPGAGAILAKIIGGGSEAQVAEFFGEESQVFSGDGKRLAVVEGIFQAAQLCCPRHELGNAFGPYRAYGLRVKNAFLPDQPGEEINGSLLRWA